MVESKYNLGENSTEKKSYNNVIITNNFEK